MARSYQLLYFKQMLGQGTGGYERHRGKTVRTAGADKSHRYNTAGSIDLQTVCLYTGHVKYLNPLLTGLNRGTVTLGSTLPPCATATGSAAGASNTGGPASSAATATGSAASAKGSGTASKSEFRFNHLQHRGRIPESWHLWDFEKNHHAAYSCSRHEIRDQSLCSLLDLGPVD